MARNVVNQGFYPFTQISPASLTRFLAGLHPFSTDTGKENQSSQTPLPLPRSLPINSTVLPITCRLFQADKVKKKGAEEVGGKQVRFSHVVPHSLLVIHAEKRSFSAALTVLQLLLRLGEREIVPSFSGVYATCVSTVSKHLAQGAYFEIPTGQPMCFTARNYSPLLSSSLPHPPCDQPPPIAITRQTLVQGTGSLLSNES